MDFWQEPVRGTLPDHSFFGLAGIEQARAWVEAVAPIPPIHYLTGLAPTAVGPGAAACSMPVTPWLTFGAGELEPHLLLIAAMSTAALSIAPAGTMVEPVWLSSTQIRPTSTVDGSLIARARVVHGGRSMALVDTIMENAVGRAVWHATGHARFVPVTPPPVPPATLEPASHPRYPTPSPYERPLDQDVAGALRWGDGDGLTRLRQLAARESVVPVSRLTGAYLTSVELGQAEARMPAHAWFQQSSVHISAGALAMAGHLVCAAAAGSIQAEGRGIQTLMFGVRITRAVPADDRELRMSATVDHRDGQRVFVSGELSDAQGSVALLSYAGWDSPVGRRSPQSRTERVLATVMFTDIVASTERASALGDARWSEVLQEHDALLRREVQRRRGRVIKGTGDGVLAVFDSPTQAVACGVAVRDAVRSLNIDVRVGIHTGECDLTDGDVSGVTVHIAARLETAAQPGQVLVSETVRALSSASDITFSDCGTRTLKGIEGDVSVFAASGWSR